MIPSIPSSLSSAPNKYDIVQQDRKTVLEVKAPERLGEALYTQTTPSFTGQMTFAISKASHPIALTIYDASNSMKKLGETAKAKQATLSNRVELSVPVTKGHKIIAQASGKPAIKVSFGDGFTVSNNAGHAYEGGWPRLNIELLENPGKPVYLTVDVPSGSGTLISCDADSNLATGVLPSIVINPGEWNKKRISMCYLELDNVQADRPNDQILVGVGNQEMSGDLGSQLVNVYTIDTYHPDRSKFNIVLDFRADTLNYWTEARKATARSAAARLEAVITKQLPVVVQKSSAIKTNSLVSVGLKPVYWKGAIDDIFIIVGSVNSSSASGYGLPVMSKNVSSGIDYSDYQVQSNGQTATLPRLSIIALSPPGVDEQYLEADVVHELMHALGLIGIYDTVNGVDTDTRGRYVDKPNAVFTGPKAVAANGGQNVPLQANNPIDNAPDFTHTAPQVNSVMSYPNTQYPNYGYKIPPGQLPTAIDQSILQDHGWCIAGQGFGC
jgi:hypothetical protein